MNLKIKYFIYLLLPLSICLTTKVYSCSCGGNNDSLKYDSTIKYHKSALMNSAEFIGVVISSEIDFGFDTTLIMQKYRKTKKKDDSDLPELLRHVRKNKVKVLLTNKYKFNIPEQDSIVVFYTGMGHGDCGCCNQIGQVYYYSADIVTNEVTKNQHIKVGLCSATQRYVEYRKETYEKIIQKSKRDLETGNYIED